MLFYQIIFILILIICLISKNTKQKIIFEYLVIFLLAFIAGLRYGIGTDFEFYLWYFKEYPKNIGHSELGFWLLGSTIKLLGINYQFYFGILTFFTLYIVRKTIHLLKIEFTYAFIVYLGYFFLIHNFNIIRHGMMVSMVWLGIVYYSFEKKSKFFLWVLLGSLFHYSGVIVFLYPLIKRIKLNFRLVCILLILFFIAGYIIYFPGIIKILAPAPDTILGFKIQKYFLSYYDGKPKVNYGVSLGTILNILILLFTVIIRDKFDQKELELINILINSLFIGLSLLFIFNSVSIFVERWTNIFYFSLVFLLPLIPNTFNIKSNKIIIYSVIVLLSFLYFNRSLLSKEPDGKYQYIPYITYYNN